MNTDNFDMNPEYNKIVLDILKRHKITAWEITPSNYNSIRNVEKVSIEIMMAAGLPFDIAYAALKGVPITNKMIDKIGYPYNWITLHHTNIIINSIKLGNSYYNHDNYYELGMKNAIFPKDVLIKKFKIKYITTIEATYSTKKTPIFYDIFQDEKKKYTFSFSKGNMGNYGYSSLVVKKPIDIINFTKWFFSQKDFEIKSIELFNNGLGGLNINEFKRHNIL